MRLHKKLIVRGLRSISKRWTRLFFHVIYPIYKDPQHLSLDHWYDWFFDLFFYIHDVLMLPEIFDLILFTIKPTVRDLTAQEMAIGKEVFGDSINFEEVFIDDKAKFLTIKHHLAYVFFTTINYWNKMAPKVLVHELVHVWQFEKYGSPYIYRALKAQRSKEGYDFGGRDGLLIAFNNGKNLLSFNFEQQASIIEQIYDYETTHKTDIVLNHFKITSDSNFSNRNKAVLS